MSKYSEKITKLVSVLDGFSQSALDSTVNVVLALRNKGLDLEDLMTFVREGGSLLGVRKERQHQLFWKQYEHKCTRCNYWMEFSPIDEPQGKANIYGWTGVWYCDNCGFEEFVTTRPKGRM